MTNKKKIEPAISQHFAKLAKKSWKVRKAKLLRSGALMSKKVEQLTNTKK